MTENRSGNIALGVLLILFGGLWLVGQFVPGIGNLFDIGSLWPLILVAIGVIFLVGALAGRPPLAVPGAILAGLGALMFVQNWTGAWESWAYAWALIPGFVGVGLALSGVLSPTTNAEQVRGGVTLMIISAVLFVVFGSFLGPFSGSLGRWWPLLLIVGGVLLLARTLRGGNQRPQP